MSRPRILITVHFEEDDQHCTGDYNCVTIKVDDQLMRTYGDYYHDKGIESAKAWADGYAIAIGGANINIEEVADGRVD